VKYMLLIYESPGARELFNSDEGAELMARVTAMMQEISESGELVDTGALAEPSNAKSVRAGSGTPAITDGPFIEAKEHFGGYLLVDCDLERALDIAARWPTTPAGGIEVWPLMYHAGADV
jgi:hypothetical protein